MAHILNNYFDHVFVIAHPDSLRYITFNQRWQDLKYELAQFVKQGDEAWANNGYAEHIFTDLNNPIFLKDPLSSGQIACAIAHMLIYKKIIDRNLSNVLILEDDSVFKELSNLDTALKSDYDVLALFTADCDLFIPPHLAAPFTAEYTKAGTSAYVIKNPKSAEVLLNKQYNKMDTADGLIRYCGLNVYAVYPPMCECDESPSIIVHGLY